MTQAGEALRVKLGDARSGNLYLLPATVTQASPLRVRTGVAGTPDFSAIDGGHSPALGDGVLLLVGQGYRVVLAAM